MASEIDFRRAIIIMGYFALGYGLIYAVIGLMYSHAITKADLLELKQTERAMTRQSIWSFRGHMLIACLIGLVAVFTPFGAFAGSLLGLIGVNAVLVSHLIKVPPPEVIPET